MLPDNITKKGGRAFSLLDFIFLYFVLFLGKGSRLFSSFDPRYNIVGTVLFALCSLFLLSRLPKPYLSGRFLAVSSILFLWISLHFVLDSDFEYFTYISFYVTFFVGYLIARVYRLRTYLLFEKYTYYLCLVSLFCWVIENILGTEMLAELAPLDSTWGGDGGSYLLYTVLDNPVEGDSIAGLSRNCGFAWEPGRFASLICIAIVCNLLKHRGRVSLYDRHLIVYAVTLLTTFSTTGYVTFLIVAGLFLLFNKTGSVKRRLVIAIAFCAVLGVISTLPFMTEKIIERTDSDLFVSNRAYGLSWVNATESTKTVDRFEGIVFDFLNFIADPIVGYGLSDKDSFTYTDISDLLVTSNGIMKPIAQMGIILGLAFFTLVFISTKSVTAIFNCKPSILLFVTIMTVSISYNFFYDPLTVAVVFSPFFLKINANTQLLKPTSSANAPA